MKIILDPKQEAAKNVSVLSEAQPKRRKGDLVGKGGLEGIDPTYSSLQSVLEKGRFVFDRDEQLSCGVCQASLELDNDLLTICPCGSCRSISHVVCLSKKFLQDQPELLVPTKGKCPSCLEEVEWAALMKEMTLRTRGNKHVQKVLKRKRVGKTADGAVQLESEDEDEDDFEEDALDELHSKHTVEDDDHMSVTSIDSETSAIGSNPRLAAAGFHPNSVIADSDDDIEILHM